MHRHLTPGNNTLTIRFNNTFKVALNIFSFYNIRRQENKTDGIFPCFRQLHILLGAFLDKKVVRNLQQHTGTVTGVHICSLTAAMVHVMQNHQSLS